ncbi:MAG: hypothetical protein OEV55_05185 [candidate division Zixibacteria bacterium]|nr:hypothetical protein [candidate division Zixibacteria bacterium]
MSTASVFEAKKETVQQQTYTPQVILSASWGDKNLFEDRVLSEPGKIGFALSSEGLECGPTAFTVAPNGDIYIADIVNDRVQRFSSNGSFLAIVPKLRVGTDVGMRVDKEGNIYTGHFYTADPYVMKYDPQGNLVVTYQITKDEEMGTDRPYHWGGQGNILLDDSGRVFVQYIKGAIEYSFQVGTTTAPFSSAQQKTSWQEGFFGITANLPTDNKRYTGNLLGVDDKFEYRIEEDIKNQNISIITKYDLISRLIGTYTLDWSKIECPLLTAFSMGGSQVFDKGNIYVFCSDKEGVRIIKWSPVEGGR